MILHIFAIEFANNNPNFAKSIPRTWTDGSTVLNLDSATILLFCPDSEQRGGSAAVSGLAAPGCCLQSQGAMTLALSPGPS